MAFIGNTVTTQGFTPAIDYFNGDGSTTAFTLSRPVASVAQVQVVVNNVPQLPGTAYTVSSNTITFTGAPSAGTSNIYVYYTSPITQVIQPSQGTVGTTQLVDASVTTAKLSSTTGTGAVALASLPSFSTTIGVGGATASASGSGVSFPATQSASSDANTLDDYEEGTWTPTYYGDGTAGTTTYTGQKGSYTKIGNRVFIELDVSWSAQTGTGSGLIGGLPFAGASYSNDSRGFVYAGAYNGSWAFTGSQVALINNSSSTFLLLYVINNGVLSASSKVTSGEFRIQMNYMTN